jgi:hypothetical protein
MRCPLSLDPLVEVAPEVYQCPECGIGPTAKGSGFFWCISEVYTKKSKTFALAARYDPPLDRYLISDVEWDSIGGVPLRHTFVEELIGELTTLPEMEQQALPVICRSAVPTLRPMMFGTKLGLKEIHQEGGRRRKS